MFFNYNILIKPGGRFFLVWRIVHQPRSSVSREDVDKLNIPELCNAVISHIPETAGYAELPYSLYLQAQLMHGIALVFNQQVGFLLKDVEEAANALKPVITKLPKKLQKRKIETDELDLSDFEDIFSRAAKKKRGGKPHPFEDFSNMRPVAVARPEDITLQEELMPFSMHNFTLEYEDDFGWLTSQQQREFQAELLGLSTIDFLEPVPEAEPVPDSEPKRPNKRVTFSGLSPLRVGTPVERARMSGDARSAPSSGGRLTDHRDDDQLLLEQSLEDNFWETPLLPTAAPGENLDVDGLQRASRQRPLKEEEEVPMDVEQERSQLSAEPYSFRLEPLGPNELQVAGRKKPRSRRPRAIRDNKTELTQAEMEHRLADYKGTCHPVVLVNTLQVPLETLFNPRPHMIKGLSEALLPVYDKVLIPVYELPMDPETKFTFDFYANHVRRFPFDLEEAVTLALEQVELLSPPLAEVYLIGSLADPNLLPDAVLPQPDNVFEAPEMPWDTEKVYPRRGLNDTDSGFVTTVEMTPLGTTAGGRSRTFEELLSESRRESRLTEVYNLSPFDPLGALPSRRSIRESPLGSRRSLLETPPTDWQNHFGGPADQGSGAAAVVFSKLVPNNTKRAAARTFYSLLELLKHGHVKAAQQNTFGEILVRTVSTE